MKIYLMQHGMANPSAIDPEEGLSSEGEMTIVQSGMGLKKLGVKIDALVASPKKRSKQTAQLIAAALNYAENQIIVTEKAKPMALVEELIDELANLNKQQIFIAGHLPSLVEISSFLLCEQGRVIVDFSYGGCLAIECEDLFSHHSKICWYLTSDQLKMIDGN